MKYLSPLLLLICAGPAWGAHIVFDLPAGSLKDNELHFVSEIAQGTHKKYEFRTSTGRLFLDRVLCPRRIAGTDEMLQDYPTSYGISPGRFNIDRDPLDLIVLGSGEIYRSMAKAGKVKPRKVRVIGLMKFDECEKVPCTEEKHWTEDWKVFAVDPADKAYAKVKSAEDLPAAEKAKITGFYAHYKGAKKDDKGVEHPQTRVTGYLTPEETWKIVNRDFKRMGKKERATEVKACEKLFLKVAKERPAPTAGKEYLDCLQRVPNPLAQPGSKHFDFFLKHNAAALLLGLGEEKADPESAFALMEKRKQKGKSYYRFVSRDLPAPPGTGAGIFEWVLTKDRDAGCPEGWPPQHYLARPLIDNG